jgi:hypothetical protein
MLNNPYWMLRLMLRANYAERVQLAAQAPRKMISESSSVPLDTSVLTQDVVEHPAHYTQGEVECIDALKSALGQEGFKAYCRGACLKYLWRTEHKNGVEDLLKCQWYLNRLIEESI